MNGIFWGMVAVFVITDAIVLTMVYRRMRPLIAALRIPDVNRRRELMAATETLIAERLRNQPPGDTMQLGASIASLLPALRDLWRAQGIELDGPSLQTILSGVAVKRGYATAKQMREALATIG